MLIDPMPAVRRPRRHAFRRVATTLVLAGASVGAVAACDDLTDVGTLPGGGVQVRPGVHRQYGAPLRVGDGRARTYVVIDQKAGGRAVEFGIALDERALENLPVGDGHAGNPGHDGHAMPNAYLLPLPARNPTPFKLVELNWNANGHEPEGVYLDVPHFDFHFYTITKAERDAIDPALMPDAEYVQRSMNYPADPAPPFYVPLAPPGPNRAVPQMGVHWSDVRAPELQRLLGNPDAYQPFTRTFLYGSWDGTFTFLEPMITRAHLLAKKTAADAAVRDEVIPIPTTAAFPAGTFRPDAYRITWDAKAREWRIALSTLAEAAR